MKLERRTSDRLSSGKIVTALLGGLFLLAGGVLLMAELKDAEKHSWHIGMAFASGVFGAGMLSPDAVFDRLKRMSGLAARFIPGTQARRESKEIDARRGD